MKTKILLFSYYLQKLAQMEQELLGVNDQQTGLLAVILAKTNLFRRFSSGCTTQELCFCNPMFAQELFIHLCLNAEENGDNLLSSFDFAQTLTFSLGLVEHPIIQDNEITIFLNEVYPEVKSKKEIATSLYVQILGEMSRDELCDKFVQLANFRKINAKALCISEPCAETAMIDKALARLKKGSILQEMLGFRKCDIYSKSPAYTANLKKIATFPKGR